MFNKALKNIFTVLVGAVLLLSVTVTPLSAAANDCVVYDYQSSFIDQWGFMILRFRSSCEEARQINVCVRNQDGSFNNYSRWILSKETVDVNVGQNVPQQTFYWTSDGTIPGNCKQ